MNSFIRRILGAGSFPRMRKQLDKIEPQVNRPIKTAAAEAAKQLMPKSPASKL